MAIARGTFHPPADEPKVWFESLRSFAEVLNEDNQELLRLILEKQPQSLQELEAASGRRSSNLSRTLRTMEQYGLVELIKDKRSVRPVVKATDIRLDIRLHRSSAA
ncbi:HVO_A0114 family putative DNA-binding protein [Geoalkalibacter halelectricus]|uniref:MarR family transcriptional regulator n=1 Tax=Geoalkalibacter halelectricus TaxID=2847045 RepID=A0ABY5ZQY5_9BACT|nr:MarR family transcriptional regulator [Geoalkalibacter halelectricus]MDO3377984.1 MarR family transcriptional regulator [Geoalkalibacter halelectricus]UWZ81513.1 MarR family transcriptional regulator [Geoalkalibacter halelectricus]